MKRDAPTGLLMAAAPDAPGAVALLARARDVARAGGDVRIILSGDGLRCADPRHLPIYAFSG